MSSPFRVSAVVAGVLVAGGAVFAVVSGSSAEVPQETITATGESPSTSAAIVSTTAYSSIPTTSTSSTSTTTTATIPPKGTLVIQGTGDVNLDPEYIPPLAAKGYDYAWDGIDGIFETDDLTVINLECAPSDLGVPEPKEFVFRCPTDSLPSLARAGIEVANLGNNHSGDYGKEALVDGGAQLRAVGVEPVGAGADAEEAGRPAHFDINGWNVAVVGFGGVFPHAGWAATDDSPGMRDGDDIQSMIDAVEAADQIADVVVVSVHWGVELDTVPQPDDVERAEALIEAGADVIFGHHAHRLQPMEMVDGAAVFWGLGNFVWPRYSAASATTGIARVVIDPDGGIEACLIPAFIERSGQPVVTDEPQCEART